jgi:hypothetical protein
VKLAIAAVFLGLFMVGPLIGMPTHTQGFMQSFGLYFLLLDAIERSKQ